VKTALGECPRSPAGDPVERAPRADGDYLASEHKGNTPPVLTDTRSANGLQSVTANHLREGASALVQTTIVDLVNASRVSTRLVNAINRAHYRRALPFATIRDYVEAGEAARDAMLSVRGVGRKVANELDALIGSALGNPRSVCRPKLDAAAVAARQTLAANAQFCETRLAELLDKIPFPSVLYASALPHQLERSLKELEAANRLSVRTLRGYLRRRTEVHALLLQQRNFGRESVLALENICASILYAVLVYCGMKEEMAQSAVVRLLLVNRDALLASRGAELVRMLSRFDGIDTTHKPINLDALSPAQFLSTALVNGPTERESEILVRRLGLEGSQRQTLEQIAGDYGLTRERIRQLERSGLKKCRFGANRAQFKRYLEGKESEIWRGLAGDRPFLPRGRVKAEAKLPGLLRLSLEVVFGGSVGWLNRHAMSIEAGRVRNGLPADEEAALTSALSPQPGDGGWCGRIEAAVDAATWSLALSDLAARSGGIPPGTIADYLEERYGAVIERGVVMQLERLGAADRLI
jgi:hypothetical protein